jgi:hypothetical protein
MTLLELYNHLITVHGIPLQGKRKAQSQGQLHPLGHLKDVKKPNNAGKKWVLYRVDVEDKKNTGAKRVTAVGADSDEGSDVDFGSETLGIEAEEDERQVLSASDEELPAEPLLANDSAAYVVYGLAAMDTDAVSSADADADADTDVVSGAVLDADTALDADAVSGADAPAALDADMDADLVSGAALDAGAVSGADADTALDADADADVVSRAALDADAVSGAALDADAVSGAALDAALDADTDADTDTDVVSGAVLDADAVNDSAAYVVYGLAAMDTDAVPSADADADADTDVVSGAVLDTDTALDADAVSGAALDADAVSGADADVVSGAALDAGAVSGADADTALDADADADVVSGAVSSADADEFGVEMDLDEPASGKAMITATSMVVDEDAQETTVDLCSLLQTTAQEIPGEAQPVSFLFCTHEFSTRFIGFYKLFHRMMEFASANRNTAVPRAVLERGLDNSMQALLQELVDIELREMGSES